MSNFVGKVVLVTGASGGIGAATAKIFAVHGATLAITGRNRKRLEEVAEECRHLGARDVLTITAEFSKLEDVAKVFDVTIKRFLKLDVLVNNVGIGIHLRLAECSVEQLDLLFNINVKSAFHLTRLAMPYLIQTKGNIVNVSTVASMRPFTNDIAYGMTKAALDQFTRIVALDYAPKGVRVNSVNPGYVKTSRRLRRFSPEELKHYNNVIEPLHPMGRGGNSNEIAKAIYFLASDASSWTTGHCLVVDGGRLLTKSVPRIKSRL